MSINTDEVNFLIYRYLEESGFHHSAYLFGYESSVINASIDNTLVPRGALISLIQKSVLFAEAEVFSLISENDIDIKFEKAIGSMSLLECTMTDAAKIKAFEKMREEISRVSSPQLTSSTTTVTNTSCGTSTNVPSTASTKPLTEICDSDKQSSTMKNNVLSTSPSCSTITSLCSINTNTEVISNISSSHFQSTSNIDNGSDIKMDYLNSITPTSSNSGLDSTKSTNQSLRDREFRAQQSQPSTGPSNSSMPRTAYRSLASTNVDNMNSNTSQSYSVNPQPVGHHQFFQQIPLHHSVSTDNPIESIPAQFMPPSSIHFTSPILPHHKTGVIENTNNADFLSSASSALKPNVSNFQANQQRFLLNGNFSTNFANNKAGPTTVSNISGVQSSMPVNVSVSGNLFDNTKFFYKEN